MFQTFEAPSSGATAIADRLGRLRERFAADGFDGFIIPRADAHQGEYVAPRDERLAYLTGFTGSAGAAVVLTERAALFADGRYTLQAADQTDTTLFEVVAIHETPVAAWLGETAPEGARIAYDPWLHGRTEVDRLTKTLAARGGELIPVASNLVDEIWHDQPPPPAEPIRVQPDDLAGRSAADKRKTISEELVQNGTAATVLTLPDSIAWLLNIRGGDIARNPVPLVFALLNDNGSVTLFADHAQVDDALVTHLGPDVQRQDKQALLAALSTLKGKRVLLDKTSCPMAIAHHLAKNGAEVEWGTDPCIMPKAQKTAAEIEGARAAHIRDGAAMARFLHWFDERAPQGGLHETEIVQRLEEERRATNQLLDISFDTIAGSGPHGAIVHYRVTEATDRALQPGELMLVDSGGQYQDGTTDITRTIATGPVPEGAARAYTLVLKGMIALSIARFPVGTTGRDLDVLARTPLWSAGLDYDHGTGHGVGSYLCVHEGPVRIARAGNVPLRPGMILSNEPGYYLQDAFGIRIENLIVVNEAAVPEGGERPMLSFETLTFAPIDTRLIDTTLMTSDEIAWLNAYHAEVFAKISAGLNGADLEWLKAACTPI
ncbi:MAG: aminopeptidase P family protein [Pikeienuella sp.]